MTRNAFSRFLILVLFLSACSQVSEQPHASQTSIPIPAGTPEKTNITGRVIDTDGNPIAGASVASQSANTTSNQDGWFDLPGEGRPEWVTAKSPGFIQRIRAVAPGVPALFRLTPDDGKTITIQFGGDTMFGRRFFDPNEDGDTSDGLLPPDPDVEAHLKLMAPIEPLLGKSDLTVLNFESPLNDLPYFSPRDPRPTVYHDTKDYVFSSDINAVQALKLSGVDVLDIGNNHLYDILETGVQSTVSALDEAGMEHFGGGKDETSAWAPSIVSVKGQSIAFIGCTTIWKPDPPITDKDVTYVASDTLKKGGAAFCQKAKLQAAILQAKKNANIVVVMIHGGFEYDRSPSNNISNLVKVAKDAGATLVINHHPHVVGGLSWSGQTLTAWSMGNFIFDQTVWPTFETYLLTVYLRDGQVIRAHADPLMAENYIPRGLTNGEADSVIREAASLPGPFVMENGALEVDIAQRATQKINVLSLDGGSESGQIITIPQSQWISGFKGTPNLLLGRELLWVGGFENEEVSGVSPAPLWDVTKDSVSTGKEYAYDGEVGIRLTRSSSNRADAVTSHLHRILITPGAKISVTGMIRASQGANAILQTSWYSDTLGPSNLQVTEPVTVDSPGQWQTFRFDVRAPKDAVALGIYLRLTPPVQGMSTVDFDNIRIIEWKNADTQFSPLYNYALLVGPGEITFAQDVLPGAESWITTPSP